MTRSTLISTVLIFFIISGCRETPRQETRTSGAMEEQTRPDASGLDESSDHVERGRVSFENFCASCHGLDGSGNGPVAEYLTVPLDDLRLLKQEHDGTFPFELVYETVDGRDDVRAHGTRVMPVWGNVWTEVDGSPMPQEFIERRINEIVEFVRSIQDTTVVNASGAATG